MASARKGIWERLSVASAAAPAERPEVDNAETHLAELQTRLEQRKSQRERLETEAMADLQNRLHRMAYEKYRDLDSLIVEDLVTLSELKRRTPELVVRARAAQQMEDLRTAQQSVRRMMSLLRVHTYGSRG